MIPFREHHLFKLLASYDQQTLPLDVWMNQYFRAHTSLGSKDRGMIAEAAYGMMRWRGLLDYLCEESISWEKRYSFYINNLSKISNQEQIPWPIRVSCPQTLYECLSSSHGEAKARDLCLICNTPAPATVRVNTLKTTKQELLLRWKKSGFQISPTEKASDGIVFHKKIHFFSLPEFKEGLFEVQDEGSQLLAALVQAEPGQQVLDYCAGSGGKALAFAPRMQNKGQIFLHDIRPRALMESRKRLRRAGIQNAQVIHPEDSQLKKLKKRMDWVLVDAPCSGTGTLRRNPDMKWKFSEEMLLRLLGQQRTIFEKALSFLKPGGRIVYATCSLLKEENQEQTNHFVKTYDLEIVEEFISLPVEGGMDGFYGAVLRKK